MANPENPDFGKLERQLSVDSKHIMKNILILWGRAMRAYLDRRFDEQSKGGKDWPPLAESTIKRRRTPKPKKRKGEQLEIESHFEKVSILMDTGQLRAALNPQRKSKGSYEQIVLSSHMGSIEVGIGGADEHKPKQKRFKKTSRPITIAELAVIHHYGLAKGVPARPIVVPPDEDTKKKLDMILEKEVQKRVISNAT